MKKLLSLLFCLSLIILTSCEDVFDCIIEKQPELPNKSFAVGYQDQVYYQAFDAHIKNEPRDNDYDYYFEVVGDLPDGLDLFINFRTLSILGVPESEGVYEFTIYLDVLPPLNYDEDGFEYEGTMCTQSTSKSYFIRVK